MTTYNVTIDENTMYELLNARWLFWLPNEEDEEIREVYQAFTGLMVDKGYFTGMEFDPYKIVKSYRENYFSRFNKDNSNINNNYDIVPHKKRSPAFWIILIIILVSIIARNTFNIKNIIYYIILLAICVFGSMIGISKKNN